MKPSEEYDVHFQFDTTKIPRKELFKIEKIFAKYGIHFDTGSGSDWRDWFLTTETNQKEDGALEIFVNKTAE